ncbi:hypothetical protein DVH24_042707 [Malus domestica]|uniref:Uncharacterized protein n=1 Tax=Malus domestica TaxID=3750 RepID=A0A498HYL3_MALDO|nr:hypothetical protein DVH24_042707 [Malus domestica]
MKVNLSQRREILAIRLFIATGIVTVAASACFLQRTLNCNPKDSGVMILLHRKFTLSLPCQRKSYLLFPLINHIRGQKARKYNKVAKILGI